MSTVTATIPVAILQRVSPASIVFYIRLLHLANGQREYECSSSQIGNKLHATRQSVTRHIRELVAAGMLTREMHAINARGANIRMKITFNYITHDSNS